jgi:hypothetical protein
MLLKKSDKPWNLYIKGRWTNMYNYMKIFHLDLIEQLGIKDRVHIIDQNVNDYNAFLEQFDYCLVPSYKEAFSYVTGECASKGIKPIINNWMGAKDLWNNEWIYQTPDEAVDMLLGGCNRESYRNWIINNKNATSMLKAYDDIIGL